jgi:hypothetical protein
MRPVVHAKPFVTPMRRGRLPACSCRHECVVGLHRQSGRNASSNGITPSTIMSPIRSQPGSWTEIRLGVRVHNTCLTHHAHGPPPPQLFQSTPDLALDVEFLHR